MELADRVQALTPSTTLAITSKAKALKEEGHDVIGLGAGEPDFNTPEDILNVAKKAMDEGKTTYTPAGGIPALKQAIIKKLQEDQGLQYTEEEIIVTTGAKHALYNLFQVLLNRGRRGRYSCSLLGKLSRTSKISRGAARLCKSSEENDFKITPEQLENSITDYTKAVILNSPSNPTGTLYTEEELKALGEVALKHELIIVSDEIYEKLIYGSDDHVSIAQLSDDLKEHTVVINGVSKSHAMTGWRIGYAAGNQQIIQAMSNLSSHSTSNPTTISQFAAIGAYSMDQHKLNEMKKAFEERLNKLYEWMTDIPGISCVKPKGAFYLFPNISEVVANSPFDSTDEWVKQLLEEEKVAVVPGSGFGSPENIRLSYADIT